MDCQIPINDPFRCPTKWELWRQILDLLPPGRAWQNHEEIGEYAGTEAAQIGTYELGGDVGMGAELNVQQLTGMQQYWAAYAEVSEYFHQRACALLEEYFCATANEQRAEWGIDYGFPDQCEPWDTLCAKVAAQGGATCEYLAQLASRNGWTVECHDCKQSRIAVADCTVADCTPLDCECEAAVIRIRIITALSPAFVQPTPFNADAAVADCTAPCIATPDQVRCLIERWKPAHVAAIYEVI